MRARDPGMVVGMVLMNQANTATLCCGLCEHAYTPRSHTQEQAHTGLACCSYHERHCNLNVMGACVQGYAAVKASMSGHQEELKSHVERHLCAVRSWERTKERDGRRGDRQIASAAAHIQGTHARL